MKNAKMIYQLMNDLLRYLLKYGDIEVFTEAQAEQALRESEEICRKYKTAPNGIGYLAWKLFSAANGYFTKREDMKRRGL
ncbi:MAG: hypothetical protein LIO86_15295 [Lachnospiraceae bacterium]|nr:hypothetical protein [Lachnospiraceae bacterium]